MADLEKQAKEIGEALEEARQQFNRAKKNRQKRASVSVRTLYLLIAGACVGYGVPLYDEKSQKQIHDPTVIAGGPTVGPDGN